jgi:hypothetical protein
MEKTIIEKVKKILSLAGNNPSEEEAQSAMLKAQEIMARHGLSMDDLYLQERLEAEVTHDSLTEYGKTSWWLKSLAGIIADNFRCNAYLGHKIGGYNTRIKLIGLREDVELAKEVFAFATKYLSHYSSKYIEKHRKKWWDASHSKKVKNDYVKGFLIGLRDKFKEQVEKNDWGLILAKDNAVTKVFKELNMRSASKTHAQSAGDNNAKSAGYHQGKKFLLTAGELEQSKKQTNK